MNLIVARAMVGHRDHLDRNPSLTFLPSSCYGERPFPRKEDKAELPKKAVKQKASETEYGDDMQQCHEPDGSKAPSQLRQTVDKIRAVDRKLRDDYLRGRSAS